MTDQPKLYSDDEARAQIAEAEAQGRAAGRAEAYAENFPIGVAEERQRVATILSSPAAKARPKAALALALDDNSPSASTAISLLEGMPDETAVAATMAAPPRSIPPLSERAGGIEIGAAHLSPAAEGNGERVGALIRQSIAAINSTR
jgi:hypothetical protein